MERKLEVHKNMTLGEVTERAYQVSNMGWCNKMQVAIPLYIIIRNSECAGPRAGAVWGAAGTVSVGEI